MNHTRRSIELLSPARNLECGIEAIRHGADAVYIGAPKFGARAAAGNSIEDIKTLCAFAHFYQARIYVALNTILADDELDEAEKMIRKIYEAGADALIVQDMGITQLHLPPIALHASTQTDNRTVEKVKFLEQVGFKQVVLARELSLQEITTIAQQTTVPLEVFVHGALCVSFSGQCYLSAAMCGRSANRGECAQYCRLPYSMTDADGKVIVSNKHLLSLKDLNLSEDLESLMDAGVSSFKIEGRLKDVAYVKNITAFYRKKIDEILAKRQEFGRPSFGSSTYLFDPVPEKSFNRGFTTYLLNGRNKEITAFDSPKSVGEVIGKVKNIKGKTISVSGHKLLNNGDGLAFFNKQGELEGFKVNRAEANKIQPFEMPAITLNTLLYRNYDAKFEQQMAKPSAERKLAVNISFSDNSFGFTLCMEDESGARIMITRPFKKEKARVSQESNIRTQLSKLGNTLFEPETVNIEMEEDWFVPSSVLTDMRQQATEKLLLSHNIRYRRELTEFRQSGEPAPFIQGQLSYLGNVANKKAESFYQQHGVKEIDKAFELEQSKNVPLMFTRHCLRYSMGWCPLHGGSKSPFKEPYFLSYKDKRLRLHFNCSNCEMQVFIDK